MEGTACDTHPHSLSLFLSMIYKLGSGGYQQMLQLLPIAIWASSHYSAFPLSSQKVSLRSDKFYADSKLFFLPKYLAKQAPGYGVEAKRPRSGVPHVHSLDTWASLLRIWN